MELTDDNTTYFFAVPKNPQKDGTKSYTGALFFGKHYLGAVCESKELEKKGVKPPKPVLNSKSDIIICGKNMTLLKEHTPFPLYD